MSTPPRSRGSLALHEGRCTSCMVCVRECPVWCIHITSHTRAEPRSEGGGGHRDQRRTRVEHVLDRFAIDFGLCMYCGQCVDACPFDALAWTPDPVAGQGAPGRGALVLERPALAALWPLVPAPEPLDPGALAPSPRARRTGTRPAR